MFRTLVLAGAAAALALPAFAATEVTINVASWTRPPSTRPSPAPPVRPARPGSPTPARWCASTPSPDCVSHTIAKAESDYAAMRGLASR